MPLVLSGTDGVSGVDGTASNPAIEGTDSNTGIFYPAADTVAIGTGGTERLRVDSSGNVGIGTSSPTQKLQISGGNANYLRVDDTTNSVVNLFGSAVGNGVIGTFSNHPFLFHTNSAERARITSGGDTLFNTTTAGITNSLSTTIETSAANNSRITVNHSSVAGSSNDSNYMQFGYGGNLIGRIVQASTTSVSYTTTSDYRLKENVQPMTGALEKIAALKPCTYTWKSSGETSQGFLAHELQAVVPECVTGEKDAVETYIDEEGNEQTRPSYQGVDTSFLVATLTAAIQEQQAMIDEMKAEIAALKGAA